MLFVVCVTVVVGGDAHERGDIDDALPFGVKPGLFRRSLAQQLGGPCATVTSLINSTSADPHDYEPTPADLAKLSRADIVVLNGAGGPCRLRLAGAEPRCLRR